MSPSIAVYGVVTEVPDCQVKVGRTGRVQYSVLAQSVAEAIAIVDESNAARNEAGACETIIAVEKLADITSGLSGARYQVITSAQTALKSSLPPSSTP